MNLHSARLCSYDEPPGALTLTISYSKLEQLEQELRTIQKVVNTKNANSEAGWSPPSPLTAFSATSDQAPPSTGQKPVRPPLSIQLVGPPSQPPEKRQRKVGPTEARVLGSIIISGQDVDYYFSKYIKAIISSSPPPLPKMMKLS